MAASAAGRGAAPAGGQAQGRGRGRAGVTNIRPASRKRVSPSCGRSGWRRSSPRSTIRRPSMSASSSCSDPRIAASTWERISPDLTGNDPSQMLLKSSSAIPYQTIVALAESPTKAGVLYAGTDDGRLHVTMDGGKTWTDLTASLPVRKWVSRIVPSRSCRGHRLRHAARPRRRRLRALRLQVDRQRQDVHEHCGQRARRTGQRHPRGSDRTRTSCTSAPTLAPSSTTNGGRQWQVLGGNLPSTQVSDLQVHPRDNVIVISTYGRGMWAMDALEVRAESLKSDVRSLK